MASTRLRSAARMLDAAWLRPLVLLVLTVVLWDLAVRDLQDPALSGPEAV